LSYELTPDAADWHQVGDWPAVNSDSHTLARFDLA
jgi:hypothetical protein